MVAETTGKVEGVSGLQAGRRVWQLTKLRLLLSSLRTNSIVIPIFSGGEGG